LVSALPFEISLRRALYRAQRNAHASRFWKYRPGVKIIFKYSRRRSSAAIAPPAFAMDGCSWYGTARRYKIANAAGIAAIGGAFFAIEAARSTRAALPVSLALIALSIAAAASFLSWMRHAAPIKDDHHDTED
jgi:hypothetical protein